MTDDDALQQARESFARRNWVTALEQFIAAGELSADDRTALARAYWWLGRADDYLRTTEDAYRAYLRDGALAQGALAALLIGYCEALRGHQDIAAGWLARARRRFDEVPDAPERGYLLVIDADLAAEAGRLDAAGGLARQIVAIGERNDDATLLALGLFLSGMASMRDGRSLEGLRLLDEAMLPVRSGAVEPEWAGNLYCRMIQLCHELGDLSRARHWTTLTEQWCHGYAPAGMFSGICRVHRVQLLQVQGEWERAETEAAQAAEDLAALDVVVAGEACYRLGEVRRIRGDFDDAEEAYRRAHEFGRDPLPGLALLHLARGHGKVAASLLDAALAVEGPPLGRLPLLAAQAEVALAGGDPGRAARAVGELNRIAEDRAGPRWRAEARRWQGALLLARGQPAQAVSALRDARSRWRQLDAPYDVARVRLDLARAADALGDHDTADRELDEAEALLARLGAHRDLDRLRAGRRGRRTPGDLTPRELEVVSAVAGGISNREAAARLHISERTVSRHLANVFVKTGTSSRTGAVAWARDRGLL